MSNLFIYCAGSFGREVLEIAQNVNEINHYWTKFYFIDDVIPPNTFIDDVGVVEFTNFLEFVNNEKSVSIVIANGEPQSRFDILTKLKNYCLDRFLVSIVSPQARISSRVQIAKGSVICSGSQISVNSSIGTNCVIYHNSLIGHDVEIQENAVISSHVNLAGNVLIEANTFIGMGSLVREGIKIGHSSVIGMGSVVTKAVLPNSLAYGNPARVIRNVSERPLYKNK